MIADRTLSRPPVPPDTAKTIRQGGFTLIEVLVASMVMAVLVFGLSGLWTHVGAQFFDLTLRQKAVFVLNGEMERLSALYQMSESHFGAATLPVTDGYGPSPPFPATRLIYPDNVGQFFWNPGQDDFVDTDVGLFESQAGHRLYLATSGAVEDDRNYAWIDKGRKIVGRLSWTVEDIVVDTCGPASSDPCYCFGFDGAANHDRCILLTLFLEFPFRLADATTIESQGTTETMVLKTILGRRRNWTPWTNQ